MSETAARIWYGSATRYITLLGFLHERIVLLEQRARRAAAGADREAEQDADR